MTAPEDEHDRTVPAWTAQQRIAEDQAQRAAAFPQIPGVRLRSEIARGGMGVVYSGVQEYLQRDVAVKVLASHLQDDEFMLRFQREAQILACISHPNIVRCFDAGVTEQGMCFLVMEFVHGPTLRAHADGEPLPVVEAVHVLRDLACALSHALDQKIIHRDVKPENVLLAEESSTNIEPGRGTRVPKLVDLGIARQSAGGLDLTAPGVVMGTQATMAPEQFDDPDSVDHRADIYGLGCTVYFGLTGEPAFKGSSTEIILAKQKELGPDPRSYNKDIAAPLATLIQEMLARAPERRPQTYREIVERCDNVLRKVSSSRTVIGGHSTGSRSRSGNSSSAWIAAVLAGAALATGGVWWVMRNPGNPASTSTANATDTPAQPGADTEPTTGDRSTSGAPAEKHTSDSDTRQSGGTPVGPSKESEPEPASPAPAAPRLTLGAVAPATNQLPLQLANLQDGGWSVTDSTSISRSFQVFDFGSNEVSGNNPKGLSICTQTAPKNLTVLGCIELKGNTESAGVLLAYPDVPPLFLVAERTDDVVRVRLCEGSTDLNTWPPTPLRNKDGQPTERTVGRTGEIEVRVVADGDTLLFTVAPGGAEMSWQSLSCRIPSSDVPTFGVFVRKGYARFVGFEVDTF